MKGRRLWVHLKGIPSVAPTLEVFRKYKRRVVGVSFFSLKESGRQGVLGSDPEGQGLTRCMGGWSRQTLSTVGPTGQSKTRTDLGSTSTEVS